MSRPETAIRRFEYDAMGDQTRITDEEGRVSQATYDERRRQRTDTNGANETTHYEYDLNDNRVETQRQETNTWEYEYDQLNRLRQITDADNQTSFYDYDSENNLVLHTDANGNTKRYECDALNRKSALHYPLTTGQAQAICRYTYDAQRLKDIHHKNGLRKGHQSLLCARGLIALFCLKLT